ncbi:protein LNK2 isoform X2 [Cucurbita pepo subsp. pepo]|uniref:protein LNK2 isoform X2 n=1 Tax=Cucurbita pepo subsp. pepo TaxID=3664 RepID=UPI000C9D7434|nr:protein LNK2 isoform X2 [Cucurbita pepo subsp. pepo]
MFDWNDEELANIIWGEAADSDDHIVPYREASENYYDKKEWHQDTVCTKLMEQKSPGTNVDDTHGRKLESSPGNEEGTSASNLDNDPLADISLSKPCRIDQDSNGTEVSHELTENSKYNSPRYAAMIKDAQNFQSTEEGKGQADFVDYGWANIGSFDDLDRIFSNDDPVFGQVSLSDADEMWSSSLKDLHNSPMKLFPTVESQNLDSGVDTEKNPEYSKQNEQLSTLASGRSSDTGSLGLQTGSAILTNVGDRTGAIAKDLTDLEKMEKPSAATLHQRPDITVTVNEFSNKIGRQKKVLKSRKRSEGRSVEKMFQDFHGNWPSPTNPAAQFDNKSPQYQRSSNPLMHQPLYPIAANAYPVVPLLSQIQQGDLQPQPFMSQDISPSGANHVDKPADGFVKSLTMTPQEKIEKLRRRQQMQAMLAIKKQQQQFNNQVSATSQSISPKCPQEIQSQHIEKTDLVSEEIYTFPAQDPKSPLEQDDSSTVSTTVDRFSMEDTTLCRLQEIISKLDFKIRLCIRDSLFRLAQSAMQRHYANDTSSSNKSTRDENETTAKGEINSHCRMAGEPDAETETNSIDRTVAHLLFHRPFEFSQNYPDAPESPISAKFSSEQKAGLKSSPMEFLSCNALGKHHISMDGSRSSWTSAEMQQVKTSPCMDTSDNTSNTGLVDDAVLEYEASQ